MILDRVYNSTSLSPILYYLIIKLTRSILGNRPEGQAYATKKKKKKKEQLGEEEKEKEKDTESIF